MADMDPFLAYLLASGAPRNQTPNDAMSAEAQNTLLNMDLQNGIQPLTQPTMTTRRNVVMPAPGPTAPLVQTQQNVVQQRTPIPGQDKYDASYNDMLEMVKQGILKQQAGVANLEQYRNEAAKAPVQVDLSPLMAYVDSIVPNSKLSSGYKAPESGAEKQHRLMGYEEGIQKANLGITDKEIEAMKTALQNSVYAKALKGQGQNEAQQARADRQELGLHAQLMNKLDRDPILQKRLTQAQNLDNALGQVEATDNLTPQQILEVQQAIRSNLGIKGTSGVEERAGTYYNSAGMKGAALIQYLTGDPASLAKDSKLMDHIRGLARKEREMLSAQTDKRLNSVATGLGSVYKRRPDLKADFNEKVKTIKEQFAAPQVSDKVTVTNGSETLSIDRADLPHALQDGYREAK